jgi:hypothetical protein
MVDTWATVGSGAQIGRDVHLAGGVGIGGVLEPPGARPVIVEDGAFIGSRCIVTEGVVVEAGAVLGAQVCITASTPIIDVSGSEPVTYHGRVPGRSVVVPGTRTRSYPAGEFQVGCALIVGQRSDSTDKKTSLNDALQDFSVWPSFWLEWGWAFKLGLIIRTMASTAAAWAGRWSRSASAPGGRCCSYRHGHRAVVGDESLDELEELARGQCRRRGRVAANDHLAPSYLGGVSSATRATWPTTQTPTW